MRDPAPPPALPAPPAADPPPSARALLAVLRRRLAVFLACAALIPTLAALALHKLPHRYTASGTLIYEPAAFKPRELQSILRAGRITRAVMASQAAVLSGLRLIEPMAERLHLFHDPEFNPALRRPGHLARLLAWARARLAPPAPHAAPAAPIGPGLDPTRDQVLLAVQAALTVTPVGESRVLKLSFTAHDPVLAAAAVNTLMDIYIRGTLGMKYRAVHKARAWLQARAAALRREVRQSADRIAAFRARAGLVRGVHAGLATEQISHLSATLAQARAALAAAQGKAAAAAGGDAASIAPSVTRLRADQTAMEAQLQSLLTRLGPNHPEVIALRGELAATTRAVAAETARVQAATGAEVAAAAQRVRRLDADLARARRGIDRNARAEIGLRAMERDSAVKRQLLVRILERLQELGQQAAVEEPDAHEVSLALPPTAPSFPRTAPLLAASVAFGLLFGLFVVYLLELTDTTLPGGDAVRLFLRRPCVALIPDLRRRQLGRLRVEDYAALKPLSAFAEQLRGLRAALWLGTLRPRAVAITAARPAEGKTTVAVALGRSACLSGERAILLDCDLRHPSLAGLFGTEGQPGLADFLRGDTPWEAVVRKDPLTSLVYVGAGQGGADGFGLFLSGAMAQLLQRLRAEFDLVLLDTPPALAMSDTRVIARLADATVLCARWRHTPREVALAAIEILEESQAAVVGVALTRVDARGHARAGYADSAMVDPRLNRYVTE